MTSRERFARAYAHQQGDRVPIIDSPWQGTINRWRREGMPKDADWRDFFDVDKVATIHADITPQYETKTVEETETYRIYTSAWGVTMKEFKEEDATPEFIDFTVKDAPAWQAAKARMKPDPSRINWAYLKENYPKWKAEGQWIQANFWFGFDVAHSWMIGTERVLVALLEEPEWMSDVFNTYLDMCIAQFDMVWKAGYHFDEIFWCDDMGYKNTPFFSKRVYRELLKPVHKRAVDWAHNKGIYAHLHSCGCIMPLLPELMEIGVDALNPIEVKAGMDPVWIKQTYGEKLILHGGINAVLWDKKDQILAEIDRILPVLKENGGYIFSSDHSIPSTVSLENFKAIVAEVKRIGRY